MIESTLLSKVLMINTTLTELDLSREHKRNQVKTNKKNTLFSSHTTENDIKGKGATSLSEALKTNTTLTKLDLWRRFSASLSCFYRWIWEFTDCRIGDIGATSLSEALKINSALTNLVLRCRCTKRHTTDINKHFPLNMNHQAIWWEKWGQHHWVKHWRWTQHLRNLIYVVSKKHMIHEIGWERSLALFC